jgi:hypothetical protein
VFKHLPSGSVRPDETRLRKNQQTSSHATWIMEILFADDRLWSTESAWDRFDVM